MFVLSVPDRARGARAAAIVTALIVAGAAVGCGPANRDAGPGTSGAASATPISTTTEGSPGAGQSTAVTPVPLAQEPQSTATPQPLAADVSVPDEDAFRNGEVIVPDQCGWETDDERPITFVDGYAGLEEGTIRMSVTVKQTAVVTLDGKPYRAVDFSCWGGGNLVYDHIGFYDDAFAPPALDTAIQLAAGPYQSKSITAVEGTLKPIENGFHLQWIGEFLATDGACAACATGGAEADFVWNGSSFNVENKVTWQERDSISDSW